MKKFWLHSLALTLGLVGIADAWGQYPNSPNNLGASSYPVQPLFSSTQALPTAPMPYAQSNQLQYTQPNQQTYTQPAQQFYGQPAQQVGAPQNYVAPASQNFAMPSAAGQIQLVANQQPQTVIQAPVPQPPYDPNAISYAPQETMGSGCQSCNTSAPSYDYGYQSSIAPTASSCGPSGCYGTPLAFSAPGRPVGYGGGHIAGLSNVGVGAKPWFFGGGVLLFNRIDNNNKALSFQDAAYAPDVLGTQDARMGVMPGFTVSFGRYFNCGKNAIQATYWGVFSDTETATRTGAAGDYRSRIPFTYVDILDPTLAGAYGNPTQGVYDWYDNAFAHSVTRSSEYHNFEVNLLGFAVGGAARTFNLPTAGTMFSGVRGCGACGGAGCGACGAAACGGCGTACGGTCGKFATGPCCLTGPTCGSKLNLTWLAGVRYFRFEDNLTYAASLNDAVINRSTDDLYYDVNTTNELVGFQIGSRVDYCCGRRINLYGRAKAGIYGNQSSLYTRIATDFQTAYLNDTRLPANPNQGQSYFFSQSKTGVAFLSELGTGLGIRMSPKWTANVGYRAVIASGVATAPDNVEYAFANYADIQDYDNYGTLILHGFDIGAVYNF
ncbi:MAG: BBP7 family outer membrane beta-barrel protein [Planctomycetales bacterium]|nr:BBP7 family outer membrane beta-barrel protein [Planctomycetales bacterium]